MESDPLRVLIIDDEKAHAEAVAESLARVGYECVIATSGKAGSDKIEKEDFDVILTDLRMQDLDGLALLRKAKQALPEAEVVLITGYGDVKTAVEAIKEGASNYLTKPVDMGELRAIVDQAGERLRLARANRELQRHGSHSGRNRHGQGVGRQGDSQQQPPQEQAVCGHELHGLE